MFFFVEQESNKLKGKELADYVQNHRSDFDGNGDALCLAAGYGIKTSDGYEKCNFSDFVKAVWSAIEIQNQDSDSVWNEIKKSPKNPLIDIRK